MTREEFKSYLKYHKEGDVVYFVVPIYGINWYLRPGGILDLHFKSAKDEYFLSVSEEVDLLVKESVGEGSISWKYGRGSAISCEYLFETKEAAQKYFDKLKRQYVGKVKKRRTYTINKINKIKNLEKEISSLEEDIKTYDNILKCI